MKLLTTLALLAAAGATPADPNLTQECPEGWSYNDGLCLWHSGAQTVPWTSVAGECFSFDPPAQPVSVHDAGMNQFLNNLANGSYTWTGLIRDSAYPDDWTWADNTEVDYTNWWVHGGEPNRGFNCAGLMPAHGGAWFTNHCYSVKFSFFCQLRP